MTQHAAAREHLAMEPPQISVLVPARNEELILPVTLPTVLKAARDLEQPAEVLVITPPTSPSLANPPISDPLLRWLPTPQPGKFAALRAGATAARAEILLLVDADVMLDVDALRWLAQPMLSGAADVVAGRIDLLTCASTPIQRLLERWMSLSLQAWHELRAERTDLLWALPGALYGIKRGLFPAEALVPLVDDVSIGLSAREAGATFAYCPAASVTTPAPLSYQH
jgi:cellulose synthase/poly-beta-1,6-N-acetylglucosamine synthase-like glycosyltransferase